MKRKKSKVVNVLLNILIVACAGVLVYSLYNIFVIQREYGKATGEYSEYQERIKLTPEAFTEAEEPEPDFVEQLREEMTALIAENPDFIAWIAIPGTNIEYPVVQGADNDYYLTHTFAGAYNTSGAIFMDYRNSPSFTDVNTIIYGHNMHNGTMFENLNLLLDSATLAEYDKVYIATQQDFLVYEIFNARQTDVNDKGYTLFPSDSAAFFQSIMGGGRLTADDIILTLSTCTYQAQSDLRVVVQAVLRESYPIQ